MSTAAQSWTVGSPRPALGDQVLTWYALLTRARHERAVAHKLKGSGITAFLPTLTEIRRWSDRRKIIESPLFSCYVFAQLRPFSADRLKALRVEGVFSIVGSRPEGTPIPDEQIQAIRTLVEKRLPWYSHPFLKIGQRVRIRSGALDGVEGVLVARNGESTLVISVDAIQRSLAVRVEGYDVQPA